MLDEATTIKVIDKRLS